MTKRRHLFANQELPFPLEEEEFKKETKHLLEGSLKARNVLIVHMIRLVVKIVNQIGQCYPHLRDDLLGEGLLALVSAVNRFPRVNTDLNLQAFASSTIRFVCVELVKNHHCMHVPARTVRHKRANGTFKELSLRGTISLEDTHSDIVVERGWTRCAAKISSFELDEIVELSVTNEEEGYIFDMVRRGCSDREIANHLGRSISYVCRHRNDLFDRFRYYWSL